MNSLREEMLRDIEEEQQRVSKELEKIKKQEKRRRLLFRIRIGIVILQAILLLIQLSTGVSLALPITVLLNLVIFSQFFENE